MLLVIRAIADDMLIKGILEQFFRQTVLFTFDRRERFVRTNEIHNRRAGASLCIGFSRRVTVQNENDVDMIRHDDVSVKLKS